jgi:hypothetical protein
VNEHHHVQARGCSSKRLNALGVATPTAIVIVVGAVEAGAIKTAGNAFVGIHEVLLWGALRMSKVCLMSSYRTLTAP